MQGPRRSGPCPGCLAAWSYLLAPAPLCRGAGLAGRADGARGRGRRRTSRVLLTVVDSCEAGCCASSASWTRPGRTRTRRSALLRGCAAGSRSVTTRAGAVHPGAARRRPRARPAPAHRLRRPRVRGAARGARRPAGRRRACGRGGPPRAHRRDPRHPARLVTTGPPCCRRRCGGSPATRPSACWPRSPLSPAGCRTARAARPAPPLAVVLYAGRSLRTVTTAQLKALVVRNTTCVLGPLPDLPRPAPSVRG